MNAIRVRFVFSKCITVAFFYVMKSMNFTCYLKLKRKWRWWSTVYRQLYYIWTVLLFSVVANPNKQLGVSTWLYRLYVWFGVDFTFSTFLESIQSKLSIWESVLFRSSQFLQHGPLINRLSLFRTQLLSAHFALAMVFICLVIMDSNDYGWCVSDWVSISLSLSRSVPVYGLYLCSSLCIRGHLLRC